MKILRCFLVLLIFTCSVFSRPLTEDIHQAAKAGDVQQLKEILQKNPDLINSTDRDKMTPLHHAIDEGKLEAASLLLANGADIDAVNYKQETPLHIAAYEGNAEVVRLLLTHDADIAKREMRDRIPLFLACNWGGDLETVRLLVDAGSDVNDKNSRGETVLVSTLYYGKKEIIDLLIDRGATLPGDEDTLRRVLYITASNGMERPFNMAVEKCKTQEIPWWTGVPIHACARGGSIEIAKALIAKGADFKEKNIYGVEPLHIAAENGKMEFIEFLLSKGADIDSPSFTGKTPLHYAQDNGHDKLATWLISKGASRAIPKFPVLKGDYLGQDKPGDTPLMFAPGIVSGHGFDNEHSPAVFSPDGKEVYWTKKFRGPILYMKQERGVWTAPQSAPFCSEYGDGEPIFSPDGNKLFFLSFRPIHPDGPTDKENMWVTERRPDGWSEPKPVSPLINACDLHWLFSIASNGTIYFASPREGGFGANDIYRSRYVNEEYQEPENLGEVINTSGIDHTPFIAPDESYLIFVSRGRSASSRDFQFYISYTNADGSWQKPIDLGKEIDSLGSGLCPAITPEGKYMFFIGRGDIYWIDASFIDKLRPKK